MEILVREYSVGFQKDLWLRILGRFKPNISPNGVIYFKGDADRDAESEFVRFCSDRNVKLTRKIFLEYSGEGSLERPFYYLSIRDTREYEQGFIEFKCDGGGKGMCWRGAKQVRKVTVTPQLGKVIERNGIVVKNYPISPRVYLISKKLMEAMDALRFSGLNFVPCLEASVAHSVEEAEFPGFNEALERQAACFQLVITGRAIGEPTIGKLLAASRCPRCGAASIIDGERNWQFRARDLSHTDFQFFNSVVSEDKGSIALVGEVPIVSARALQFFIASKIKGLRNFSTDPPIKYAAVDLRE